MATQLFFISFSCFPFFSFIISLSQLRLTKRDDFRGFHFLSSPSGLLFSEFDVKGKERRMKFFDDFLLPQEFQSGQRSNHSITSQIHSTNPTRTTNSSGKSTFPWKSPANLTISYSRESFDEAKKVFWCVKRVGKGDGGNRRMEMKGEGRRGERKQRKREWEKGITWRSFWGLWGGLREGVWGITRRILREWRVFE